MAPQGTNTLTAGENAVWGRHRSPDGQDGPPIRGVLLSPALSISAAAAAHRLLRTRSTTPRQNMRREATPGLLGEGQLVGLVAPAPQPAALIRFEKLQQPSKWAANRHLTRNRLGVSAGGCSHAISGGSCGRARERRHRGLPLGHAELPAQGSALRASALWGWPSCDRSLRCPDFNDRVQGSLRTDFRQACIRDFRSPCRARRLSLSAPSPDSPRRERGGGPVGVRSR